MSRSPGPRPAEPAVAGVLVAYTLARIGLLVLVAGLLVLAGTPFVIAALVALVVALPLSMLLFRGLRGRLEEALAVARERRGAQRAALRAGLRGDPGAPAEPDVAAPAHADRDDTDGGSGDRSEGQPDRGRG